MTIALIILSALNIPSADELGLLMLTYVYGALCFICFGIVVLAIALKPSLLDIQVRGEDFIAVIIPFVTIINFVVASFNDVAISSWLARSAHLLLLPLVYFAFRFEGLSANKVWDWMCVAGFLEAVAIYGTFIAYFDAAAARRAADIEGVLLYSAFFICAVHNAAQRYHSTGRSRYLALYVFLLGAAMLTGTRLLMVASLVPMIFFASRRVLAFMAPAAILVGLVLAPFGFFDRFDLTNPEYFRTVASKIQEVVALWGMFVSHPLVGVGLGKEYTIWIVEGFHTYTYSHNILLFYLGYGGLLLASVALYPFARVLVHTRGPIERPWVFCVSIFLFYSTNTTFTTLKHTVVVAGLLYICAQGHAIVRGGRDVAMQPVASG